jgi:hypothetical protein
MASEMENLKYAIFRWTTTLQLLDFVQIDGLHVFNQSSFCTTFFAFIAYIRFYFTHIITSSSLNHKTESKHVLICTVQLTSCMEKKSYWGVIFLLFFLGLGSSLGSLISRIPSAMFADTFSMSMLSPNPIRLRNVENARSLCK